MKIGGITQARSTSSRFPRKHLQALAGKPVLAHLFEGLRASRHLVPEEVAVFTTSDPHDDDLCRLAETLGAKVFRGDSVRLIDRFTRGIQTLGYDAVIQIDGDDPLADPGYMDRCMDRLLSDESFDFVATRGIPYGFGSKAIRRSAFERVWATHGALEDDTTPFSYFINSPRYQCEWIDPVDERHRHGRARFTLDYPEDLRFLEAVLEASPACEARPDIGTLLDAVRRTPALLDINAHRIAS